LCASLPSVQLAELVHEVMDQIELQHELATQNDPAAKASDHILSNVFRAGQRTLPRAPRPDADRRASVIGSV